MAITEFLSKGAARYSEFGLRGIKMSLVEGWWDAIGHIGRRVTIGTNVFEREWDVLIILDGCRPDILSETLVDYEIPVSSTDSIWSVGSMSAEWIEKTFVPEYKAEIGNTVYVSGNPHAEGKAIEELCKYVEHVYEYGWDDVQKTIPRRPITDAALRAADEYPESRLIVHYMQPHAPFLAEDAPVRFKGSSPRHGSELNNTALNRDTWANQLRYGDISKEVLFDAYEKNLRYVLEDVELLLNNLSRADVVLSADHGNAFGENGVYGHPIGVPTPEVKRVPWVKTSGRNLGCHEPGERGEIDNKAVEDRLADLGYM